MQTTPSPSQSITLERKKVYDPVLRILHWTFAVSVIGLALTGFVAAELVEDNQALEKAIWSVHIGIGWALGAALGLRAVWALLGPRHARWQELWQWRAWMSQLSSLRARRAAAQEPTQQTGWGHDARASLAYLGFFGLVALMVLSGVVLAAVEHNAGPLAPGWLDRFDVGGPLEEVHEIVAWLIVGFVGLHVAALVWHERREGRPLAQAMVSGYQYRRVQRVVAWAVSAMALATMAGSVARAATPAEILQSYARAAVGQTPFSAARGKVFYEQVIGGVPERSCSSCHTSNPRQAGTSSAGKTIEPLAGNPTRFTDPAKVEKWFRRNCNDVLARACTAAEKGDFITYILSR